MQCGIHLCRQDAYTVRRLDGQNVKVCKQHRSVGEDAKVHLRKRQPINIVRPEDKYTCPKCGQPAKKLSNGKLEKHKNRPGNKYSWCYGNS